MNLTRALSPLLALSVIAAAAAAEAPPRHATVSDLIQHPTQYFDQRLVVTGVVNIHGWGPDLCELPSATTDTESGCIDLYDVNLPFRRFDPAYDNAIIQIVGYFTRRCFLPADETIDGVKVEVVCVDRGGNGWISAETARVIGAVSWCPDPVCEPDAGFALVEAGAAEAAGIDEFAMKLVGAVRRGDAGGVLELSLPSRRAETAWLLGLGDERMRDGLVPGDLAHAPASVTMPGVGYRLVSIDDGNTAKYHELCFCTTGDCSRVWKFAGQTPRALRRLPFRCYGVVRTAQGWMIF